MFKKINKLINDTRGQISLEFLIILGIAILAAVAVGFYLKQISAKNAAKATELQNKAIS
jgi:uncharacterized protein (UPF0333 family)